MQQNVSNEPALIAVGAAAAAPSTVLPETTRNRPCSHRRLLLLVSCKEEMGVG